MKQDQGIIYSWESRGDRDRSKKEIQPQIEEVCGAGTTPPRSASAARRPLSPERVTAKAWLSSSLFHRPSGRPSMQMPFGRVQRGNAVM